MRPQLSGSPIFWEQIKTHDLREATAKTASLKKRACYIDAALLATGGTALLTFSALMQFNSQFVLLVGLYLPPVALAVIAITGLAMLAAGAYMAYRTSRPVAPVAAKPDAAVQNKGCIQRLSEYVCCFNLFKQTAPANDKGDTLVVADGLAAAK